MKFISPHTHIKNISTNGTILTEYLLNTSRGPWTPKKTKNLPNVTGYHKQRMKGKGRGEEAGWDLHSWQGAEAEVSASREDTHR